LVDAAAGVLVDRLDVESSGSILAIATTYMVLSMLSNTIIRS
jgi:hypothetical protein